MEFSDNPTTYLAIQLALKDRAAAEAAKASRDTGITSSLEASLLPSAKTECPGFTGGSLRDSLLGEDPVVK